MGKNWMVNKENKEYSKQKKEHEQERSENAQTYLRIQKSRLLRTMGEFERKGIMEAMNPTEKNLHC